MIAQQGDGLGDIVQLILLLVALVLVTLALYISMRLIAGKKDADAGYLIRLIVVALIVVIAFPAIGGALAAILELGGLNVLAGAGLGSIVIVLLFVLLIYVVKILLMPESASYERWERSIWISTIAVFFVLLINAVAIIVIQQPLVPFFVG